MLIHNDFIRVGLWFAAPAKESTRKWRRAGGRGLLRSCFHKLAILIELIYAVGECCPFASRTHDRFASPALPALLAKSFQKDAALSTPCKTSESFWFEVVRGMSMMASVFTLPLFFKPVVAFAIFVQLDETLVARTHALGSMVKATQYTSVEKTPDSSI